MGNTTSGLKVDSVLAILTSSSMLLTRLKFSLRAAMTPRALLRETSASAESQPLMTAILRSFKASRLQHV